MDFAHPKTQLDERPNDELLTICDNLQVLDLEYSRDLDDGDEKPESEKARENDFFFLSELKFPQNGQREYEDGNVESEIRSLISEFSKSPFRGGCRGNLTSDC